MAVMCVYVVHYYLSEVPVVTTAFHTVGSASVGIRAVHGHEIIPPSAQDHLTKAVQPISRQKIIPRVT